MRKMLIASLPVLHDSNECVLDVSSDSCNLYDRPLAVAERTVVWTGPVSWSIAYEPDSRTIVVTDTTNFTAEGESPPKIMFPLLPNVVLPDSLTSHLLKLPVDATQIAEFSSVFVESRALSVCRGESGPAVSATLVMSDAVAVEVMLFASPPSRRLRIETLAYVHEDQFLLDVRVDRDYSATVISDSDYQPSLDVAVSIPSFALPETISTDGKSIQSLTAHFLQSSSRDEFVSCFYFNPCAETATTDLISLSSSGAQTDELLVQNSSSMTDEKQVADVEVETVAKEFMDADAQHEAPAMYDAELQTLSGGPMMSVSTETDPVTVISVPVTPRPPSSARNNRVRHAPPARTQSPRRVGEYECISPYVDAQRERDGYYGDLLDDDDGMPSSSYASPRAGNSRAPSRQVSRPPSANLRANSASRAGSRPASAKYGAPQNVFSQSSRPQPMQGPPSKANAKGHSGGRDVEDLQNELFNIRREIKQFAEENKVLKTKLARAAHEIQSRDARIEVLDTERWQLLEMQSRSERMIQAITLELAAAQTRKRAAKPKQPARV